MLAEAIGGHNYYVELRGLALERAAYCINRVDKVDRKSAYHLAWGYPFNWGDPDEYIFGARCIYKTRKNNREKMESVSEVGIWVGRDLNSNQHRVVPLTGYTPSTGEYELGKCISVRTVKVFNDQFPLRCIHTNQTDLMKFEGFVDRFDPNYQHIEPNNNTNIDNNDDEYEVENIIGYRKDGNEYKYIIEWKSGEVTVEPESYLEGCKELLDEYKNKIESIESACVINDTNRSDLEKMILELQQKSGVPGEVEEWVPGVRDEMNSVTESRLEEVSEEVRNKVIREGLAMKLRMILELKKDGRRKGRWVGQGFLEGFGVTGEHIDSPVASFAAIRMLLFMADRVDGGRDIIASGDITKAYLKADEFDPGSVDRYVKFRMHKHAEWKVWRLKGPLYGSRDSPKL